MEQDDEEGMFEDIKSDLAAEEMFKQEILPEVKITKDEVDKVTEKKLIEYDIRWLYSYDENSSAGLLKQLKGGIHLILYSGPSLMIRFLLTTGR